MAIGDKVSNSPLDPRIVTPSGIPSINHETVEKASQSYNRGQILVLEAAGVVSAPTAGQAMGDLTLAGIACKDATGVTGASSPVEVPDINSEILIRGGTSGTEATVTTTLFPIGDAFDIWVDANGQQTLDSGTETNAKLVVVDYVRDVNGDLTPWMRCRPLTDVWAFLNDPIS